MLFLFRRRRPTAAEIIATSLDRGDYKTAALLTVAGCLEVLHELNESRAVAPAPAEKRQALERTLAPATL